jgi:hypothetical protein
MARAQVVEESWEQLRARLAQTSEELQAMLVQLYGQQRPARFRRYERSLKQRARAALGWIEATLAWPKPGEEEQERFVLSLYRLDEALPQLVDDFHRLLEATGEAFPG